MDEEHEYLLYEASVRQDRPPLQASQVTQAAVCPGSAAFSAVCDEAHQGHTLSVGGLWLGERPTDDHEPAPLDEGCLSDVRLSLLVNGSVAKLGEEETGPVLQARVPFLWAEPGRLVRDAGGWRCPVGSSLYVSGELRRSGRIVYPRDFGEIVSAGALAAAWTRSSGNVVITVQGPDDALSVTLTAEQSITMLHKLRRAAARVEGERQRLAKGERLHFLPGLHCEDCILHLQCDVWTGAARAVALSLPSDKIDVVTMVAALTWLRSSANMVASMLRRHVSDHGPIALPNGALWTVKTFESRNWPAAHVARTIDLETGTNISSGAVRVSSEDVRRGLVRAAKVGGIKRDKVADVLEKVATRMKELGDERVTTHHRYGKEEPEGGDTWE